MLKKCQQSIKKIALLCLEILFSYKCWIYDIWDANITISFIIVNVGIFCTCALLKVYLFFKECIFRTSDCTCMSPSLITKLACWMTLMWFQGLPQALIWPKCLAKWYMLIWGDGKATGFVIIPEINCNSVTCHLPLRLEENLYWCE